MSEFISRLTWVDYLTVLSMLWGGYVGYKSGLFPELLRIVAYVVTVIVTLKFHETLAQYLTLKTFLNNTTSGALAFLVLLIGVFFLLRLITIILLKLLKVGDGGFVNRVIGALIGGCRWVILLSLVFMVIDRSPLEPLKEDIHHRSVAGPKVMRIAPMLFDFLSSLSPQLAVEGKKTACSPM